MRYYRHQINQSPDHFYLGNIATSCPKEYPFVYSYYGEVGGSCCKVKPFEDLSGCPGGATTCTAPPCVNYSGNMNVMQIISN